MLIIREKQHNVKFILCLTTEVHVVIITAPRVGSTLLERRKA